MKIVLRQRLTVLTYTVNDQPSTRQVSPDEVAGMFPSSTVLYWLYINYSILMHIARIGTIHSKYT